MSFNNSFQYSGGKRTGSAGSTFNYTNGQRTDKTPYQQNLSNPVQMNTGLPTNKDIYSRIWEMGQTDPEGAKQKMKDFINIQNDPSSPYFNPYRNRTNRSADSDSFKTLGIDTSNIDDDWFANTAYLENYLHYDGTTNAPTKPKKNASAEEWAAYDRNQLAIANDLTKQAQMEWAAMQGEIDYWTSQSGRNYSDDEIIEKIYGKNNENLAKKYPVLARMENSLQTGKDILELNSAINYSKNNAYTAIWRSRNGGGTGDWDIDALMSVTGQYNDYVEDPDITARMTTTSPAYAPWTVGSTMDDVCVYYGQPSFTSEEIANMKPDGSDKTEGDMWNRLYDADQFTIEAEQAADKFNQKLEEKLATAENPEEIMKWVNNRLKEDQYSSLKKLNDSKNRVNDLIDTTRPINFSYYDVQQRVNEACEKNRNKEYPAVTVQNATTEPGEGAALTTQDVENAKVADKNIRDAQELAGDSLTGNEASVLEKAGSSMYDYMRGLYNGVMAGFDRNRKIVAENAQNTAKNYVTDFLPVVLEVANYNTVSDSYDQDSAALADYQRRFGNLADYYDEFQEQKQSELEDGTPVYMHYDADKKKYVLDSIGMMVPEELEIYDEGSEERQLLQQAMQLVSEESARAKDIQYAHARLQYGGKEIRDEIERYGKLTADVEKEKNYLAEHDLQYDEGMKAMEKAENEMRIMRLAGNLMGADVSSLDYAVAMSDYFSNFAVEPPRPNHDSTYLERIQETIDSFGVDATPEMISQQIQNKEEEIRTNIQLAQEMLGYSDETGIELPDNYRQNMEYYLEDWQNELKGLEYAKILTDTDPDELEATIEAGREFEEKYAVGDQDYWTKLFQEATPFYTLHNQMRYSDENGEPYRNIVSEEDEKTYYYLLGKAVTELGEDLDNAIANIGNDPDTAKQLIDAAFGDAREYQQYMESDVWKNREYKASVEFGQRLAESTPVLANIMATGATVGESVASFLEILDKAVFGGRFDSQSFAGRLTGAKNAIREETKKSINETFGKDTLAGRLANIGYEIYCNRGDSTMNMLAFGWMTGGLGGMAGEFIGSMPMAFTAALSAAAEAVENGASTDQAWLIAGVTFLAEAGTEAITLSNIKEAFGTAEELSKESLKGFLKDWLAKDGLEEVFGEVSNNIIERAADNWAARMGNENYKSEHQRAVEKYLAEGKGPEEAESLARMDEIQEDMHTAIVSYLSAGTDVVVQTGKAALNTTNYYRTATRAAQQAGDSRSMLRHMLDDHKANKEAKAQQANQPGIVTTTTTTKGNQEAETGFEAEDVEMEFPDVEPAVAAEQEAEQQATESRNMAYAKDLEVLTTGIQSGATASVTASMAAVLNTDGSDVSVDRANAAAVKAGDVFDGGIEEIRNILAGGAEAGTDNQAVKLGIMNAILGGESSESYQMIQSEEFQTATDEQKAEMLAQTGEQDMQNAAVQQAIADTVKEIRIAEKTRNALAQGAAKGALEAKAQAEQAASDAAEAQEQLEVRQGETNAADEARAAAAQEAIQNPTDDNVKQADQANQKFTAAVAVEQEYEQSVKKAEEKRAEAERKAQQKLEEDLSAIRGQASAEVAQEDQQRAEIAAQREEQRMIREQEAAQAQAEEDQKSGKADEDKTRKLAEDWANNMRLEGNERDSFIQRVMDRQEQKALGKIDLTGKVSNAEGYLAINAFARKTGLQFNLSDNLPDGTRGKYQNGKVFLNANLVRSGQMTIGQALVEASLHEMTHSMEQTRNYRTYRKTVLDSLFGAGSDFNQAAYNAAIDTKIADYTKIGQNLTKSQAEQEIVADFARTHLADKEVVQRFMDSGLGGKMRNTLHNINQALKNFFSGMTGEERKTAEYLRKAERAYQKALNEAAKTAVHPEGGQFSVQQFAEAAGLYYNDQILKGKNGEEFEPGLYTSDPSASGANAVRITEVTPDMIRKTPMGMLIDIAENGMKNKKGDVITSPTIDKETADKQRKMFADLMTMTANYQNSDLVWEIAGSTLYSALKENADTQYSNTVDFGTICAKTQEIVNVLSRVMQEKVKLGKGGGLTRADVLKVYNETAKAGLTVPCPVCYVFSRWMGVPSLLGQMSQYQKDYVVLDDPNNLDSINWGKTQEVANEYIKKEIEKYGSFEAAKDAKNTLADELDKQESKRLKAAKILNSEKATEEQKAEAQKDHDDAVAESVRLEEEIGKAEAFNWVTQALCKQVRVNGKDENVVENGVYLVDDSFRMTPDSVIFDLRKTGEFAKYTKNWGYRNSRGASMGKAIMPYSGEDIGDIIHGTTRWTKEQNPFKNNNPQKAANAIKDAMARVAKQNLIGGQRLQSTSDFRPEWGLDYMMTYLELQAIGSKVQMYTKVAEAVDLLASMGGDINLSIMGAGKGWHVDENGQTVLDFSDVTGMKYETARALKDKYSNVQMILVGMNDKHIQLALSDSDIDFVIPWHSSGNTKDALASMIASVGEKLETSDDYQNCQSDKRSKNQTPEQAQLWDLRVKILTGKDLTEEDRRIIYGDKYLNRLYTRFNLEGEDVQKAIENDEFLRKHYERLGGLKDNDCYGVSLNGPQANQIFPYEYWDTSLTKDQADENGWNFIEYCQHFGMVPRFSGANQKNEDGKTKRKIGNFAGAVYDAEGADGKNILGYDKSKMTPGYWKLLIDRPMYDNDGNYRDQQVVNVTNARVGNLSAPDEQGIRHLENSDMPIQTSAKYTSDKVIDPDLMSQEDEAVYNSLVTLTGAKPYGVTGQASFYGEMTDADIDQALAANGIEDRRNATYIPDGRMKGTGEPVDFINLILDGKKTGETRTHNKLSTTQWLGLAKDGYVYGRVKLGKPYQITKDSPEYNTSYIEGVESSDGKTDYDIPEGGSKWYYPIEAMEDFRDNLQPILRNGNYGRYSAGGEITDADIDQMLVRNGVVPQLSTEQNGNLPGPVMESGGPQRQFGSKTAQGSDALHQDVKDYLYTHSDYTPDTNSNQIDRAIAWVRGNANQSDPDGFFNSMRQAQNGDFDSISADGQARMLTLMSMAAIKGEETGDHSAELILADMFNKQGTEAGRALQARKMFRLMTPVGRMATLEQMENQINEEYGRRGNEHRVHLSQWVLDAAAVAESEEDFNKVRNAAKAELAAQMPANWKEKFSALRMLAMLGNIRTHGRNVLGNLAFMPAVALKNKIGAAIETAFVDEGERTKTIGIATPEARAFAKQYAKKIESLLRGESKYNEGNSVSKERKMFGQGDSIISKTLGQAAQALIDVNGRFLEGEDWIFLERHFRNSFAGYMTANNLTEADMKGDVLDRATAYAVNEAQKATYRDANEIANWMNNVKNPAARFVINAVLPFKKTPMNILRRGVEYSPVSLIRSLTTDAKHLKEWNAYQRGELSVLPDKAISPTQYIDRLASGASGTVFLAIGALLSSLGFLKGGMDDDDDEFEKLNGSQEYSLEIGGVSFTIDWAAPICMPLFVGATIMEQAQKSAKDKDKGISVGSVLDAILGIAEPVTQLSMLDGLNSVLNPSNYGDSDSLVQVGEKVLTNYATSYVPTLFGQFARSIDTTRRKNFVESGADLKTFRSALEQIENKIPFLSRKNIPYRNVWGEADESPQGWAIIENFLSPGYGNILKNDLVTNELKRIYQETRDPNMIPKAASKTISIGGKSTPLTAEQYDQYVVDRGQTAHTSIQMLMESPAWQFCDDQTRAMMVTDAWSYANQIARHNLDKSIKKESWVANAEHNGNFVETVVDRAANNNRKDYIAGYGQIMAEALDSNDSEMYDLSLAAMENAEATEAERRAPLRDYFKPRYQQAFEEKDEDAMDEIMEKLLDAGVGFKEKDIRSWLPSEDEELETDYRWLNEENYR